eukprot:TRINITY_DN115562_c0_g1_i1.p1 TRINITY_DN115562_c0_g1~~TRINITY_DN115562_c0_g1_i1.p1  ORF type:complete len:175 (+),score=15.24 TRINITY_DN115562_c0_g1_i1:30-554(+)
MMRKLKSVQFIAALGDPQATKGTEAKSWGIWRIDPGPRGVPLRNWKQLQAAGGVAPAKWKFDQNDWWVEEHGLIMEKPDFPLPAGKYLVTGGREMTTELKVDNDGHWELGDGAKLHDVTHLPCRSARYSGGSPADANLADFPVKPGGKMPAVGTCKHQDYWVLFVLGIAEAASL